jgi:hypothetical protein
VTGSGGRANELESPAWIQFPIGVGNVVALHFSQWPTEEEFALLMTVLENLRPSLTEPDRDEPRPEGRDASSPTGSVSEAAS